MSDYQKSTKAVFVLLFFYLFISIPKGYTITLSLLESNFETNSFTTIDTAENLNFIRKRFDYLYNKYCRLRVGHEFSIENYELVHNGQLRDIPALQNSIFTVACDCSGANKSLVFSSLYLNYRRSYNPIEFISQNYNSVDLGFGLYTLKLFKYKLELELFIEVSIYSWTKSETLNSVFTIGVHTRYNLYNRLSFTLSLYQRDGCDREIGCTENSLNNKNLQINLGFIFNI